MIRERRGERRGTGRQTQRNVKGNQMWGKKRNMFTLQPFFFKKKQSKKKTDRSPIVSVMIEDLVRFFHLFCIDFHSMKFQC